MLIECGGKDALIVDDDADLDAAADAAAWGGLANAGQTCVGIERVYVVDAVYDDFVERLADQARGPARRAATRTRRTARSPCPRQVDVIRRHVNDALARGARAVVGGARVGARRRTSTRSCWSTSPRTPPR